MQALILAGNGVEDWELMYPFWRCREEGIAVDVAAPEEGPIEGKHNCYPLVANVPFCEMWGPDYYSLLILPGGVSQEVVRVSKHAVDLARSMVAEGKVVAAIGHGIETLVSAGVMKGRRATCAAGVADELKLAGAEYVDEEVVVDGNIVTGRGAEALPGFCREMLKLLHR
jgi:protease I